MIFKVLVYISYFGLVLHFASCTQSNQYPGGAVPSDTASPGKTLSGPAFGFVKDSMMTAATLSNSTIPSPHYELESKLLPEQFFSSLKSTWDCEAIILNLNQQKRALQKLPEKHSALARTLNMNKEWINAAADAFTLWLSNDEYEIQQLFRLWKAFDFTGNHKAHFSGYYTPWLIARKEPDSLYRYPLYSKPEDWEGRLPSRAEIDGKGALDNQGLEIAWTANPIANYSLHLQGSGFVEYEDGSRQLLGYGGNNGYPYRNIDKISLSYWPDGSKRPPGESILPSTIDSVKETLFKNPSYTFFLPTTGLPEGAIGVPLVPEFSVAVDPEYIPHGSLLLAEWESENENGKMEKVYRLLIAQDSGGAIKGPTRIDLYFGTGTKAGNAARRFKKTGKIWILVPNSLINFWN